ncbi:unnamed protein product [Cunninghamella echinulata]
MNYSIPKNSEYPPTPSPLTTTTTTTEPIYKREIQEGSSDTRSRQLESQIEALTLSNVRLQRVNRLLKVDTDNIIEQKTQPLKNTIRELTLNNVQLQRTTRLLQQDLEDKINKLNQFHTDQVLQMKNVGPEYEYLVQMINLLHRQINGDITCESTCCYTAAPIDQSTVIMTLPPEDGDHEEEGVEAQHVCRPIIHSSISQGSFATELEKKVLRLEQRIEELENEKEVILRQQSFKDEDIEMLKRELQIKDDIVSQLEQDFMDLEEKLVVFQKDVNHSDRAIHHHSPSPPPDPKRQSQMLMESKRRSLAIKDTDLLEKMLRGDLDMENHTNNDIIPPSPTASTVSSHSHPKEENDNQDQTSEKVNEPPSPPSSNHYHQQHPLVSSKPLSCSIPCSYSTFDNDDHNKIPLSSPAPAIFVFITFILGCAAKLSITDDWTLPFVMAVLVSGFLWTGGAKGVQLKVKLK